MRIVRRFYGMLLVLLLIPAVAPAGTLAFRVSPYGLLFAEISVEGRAVDAMIDFGDPYALQLSTTFLAAHGIEARPSGKRFQTVDGAAHELLEGTVRDVVIGGLVLEEVTFGAAPGEIDAVADLVGTPFEAVVGWGFFGERRFVLDYAARALDLRVDACPADADASVGRRPGSSHLVVDGRIGGRDTALLIDTGSPVNVVDADAFARAVESGETARIEHVAGTVEGRRLPVRIGAWNSHLAFDVTDLGVLEPMGVDAVLGGEFLRTVRICHDPADGALHVQASGR